MSLERAQALAADKSKDAQWLTVVRASLSLFIAGYVDTNTVQRAHMYLTGMSGNLCAAARPDAFASATADHALWPAAASTPAST